MKTASRGTPNCRTRGSGNRAHGAGDQNRSCSIKWAAKVEKYQPRGKFFFLTFPFIELALLFCVDRRVRLNLPTPRDKLSRAGGKSEGSPVIPPTRWRELFVSCINCSRCGLYT